MIGPTFHNSGVAPVAEWMVLRKGGRQKVNLAIRFGLWRHPQQGLILIDTGYGPAVCQRPARGIAMRIYAKLLGIRMLEDSGPAAVLARSGFSTDDVSMVILTHFHADHIARLDEFPRARIVASGAGHTKLQHMSRLGQWHNGFFRELLPSNFEARLEPTETFSACDLPFGLGRGYDILDDGSCLAVPLDGHAVGHFGILWPKSNPPLLFAADTQWLWRGIAEDRCPGLPARAIYNNAQGMRSSVTSVRNFAACGGAVVLSHDPDHGPHSLGGGNC